MTPTPHERALALAQEFGWDNEDHGAAILAIERSIGEAEEAARRVSAELLAACEQIMRDANMAGTGQEPEWMPGEIEIPDWARFVEAVASARARQPMLVAFRDKTISVEAAEQLVAMTEDKSMPVHEGKDLPKADRDALLARARERVGPILESLQEIWNAGLSDWAKHLDPEALLREIRGEEPARLWSRMPKTCGPHWFAETQERIPWAIFSFVTKDPRGFVLSAYSTHTILPTDGWWLPIPDERATAGVEE